jgi:hypothetical protein
MEINSSLTPFKALATLYLIVDETIGSIVCEPLIRISLKKMVRVSSKEILEEVGDGAPPLLIFLLAEGVGLEDGPTENDPPPLLFSDNLQVQCLATIEREGA